MPVADARIFLTSGGSDSVDIALKMTRQWWRLPASNTAARTVAVLDAAYHGMHLGGTAVAGIPANMTDFNLSDGVVKLPRDDITAAIGLG